MVSVDCIFEAGRPDKLCRVKGWLCIQQGYNHIHEIGSAVMESVVLF